MYGGEKAEGHCLNYFFRSNLLPCVLTDVTLRFGLGCYENEIFLRVLTHHEEYERIFFVHFKIINQYFRCYTSIPVFLELTLNENIDIDRIRLEILAEGADAVLSNQRP